MAYLLDGAVILIFILFVWVGSRRGLVRSVLRLISCVVSLVLALLLSTVAAGGLFDAFLSESAQEIIAQHLPETDAASVASGVEEALHQLPGFVESALTAGGLGSPEEIASSVQDVLGQSPETVAQAITEQVIRPAAVALMGSVCFLLLFLLYYARKHFRKIFRAQPCLLYSVLVVAYLQQQRPVAHEFIISVVLFYDRAAVSFVQRL